MMYFEVHAFDPSSKTEKFIDHFMNDKYNKTFFHHWGFRGNLNYSNGVYGDITGPLYSFNEIR